MLGAAGESHRTSGKQALEADVVFDSISPKDRRPELGGHIALGDRNIAPVINKLPVGLELQFRNDLFRNRWSRFGQRRNCRIQESSNR